MVAAPWHLVETDPRANSGVPTGGVTVTVSETGIEEPHPLAITEITAVPEKSGSHVTVPVGPVPDIVFPFPVTDQL